MTPHAYAHALYEVIEGGISIDDALSRLDRVLQRHGHMKLKKRILMALHQLFLNDIQSKTARLYVARTDEASARAREIQAACDQLAPGAPVETVVDETLVGGYAVETRTHVLDRSYKRTLLRLYRSIITREETPTS